MSLLFQFFFFCLTLFSVSQNIIYAQDPNTDADVDPDYESKQVVIQLQNHQDKGHFFTIRVGESSKNYRFTMLLDITNPSIWIPAQGCENCFGSFLYNCDENQDTCYQDKNEGQTELVYHSISAIATKGFEMLHFKGIPVTESFNHTVYLASQISEPLHKYNIDGVFGMGLDNNLTGTVSILNSLYENGWISNQCFSLYLIHNPGGSDTKSHIVFGGYDPHYIHNSTSDFMRVPLASENFWAVNLNGIALGNQETKLQKTIALLSNNFPDIGMPKEDLGNILSSLKKQGIDCKYFAKDANPFCKCLGNRVNHFPHLLFQLDGFDLNISRSSYVSFRAIAFKEDLDMEAIKGYNCFLRLRVINTPTPPPDDDDDDNDNYDDKNNDDKDKKEEDQERTWVFGRTVLNDYYTLFDKDNRQIGFAKAVYQGENYQAKLKETLIYCFIGFAFCAFSLIFFIYKALSLRRRLQSKRELDGLDEPLLSARSSGLFV